ncbi:hypothetical protein [Bacillus cereus]
MEFLFKYGIPITISLASFTISLITYRMNKKCLDVTFEEELFSPPSLKIGSNYLGNDNGIYIAYLKVVNPSPSDIAYFDLRVIDKNNPHNDIEIHSQTAIESYGGSTTILSYTSPFGKVNLSTPLSDYGVFKSNSFTKLDIAFSPILNTEEVVVTFKVAIKSIKSSPYSSYGQQFKYYSKTYRLRDARPIVITEDQVAFQS